ncbi:MAG: hypothetical protein ACLFMM_08790, partial [Methanohalobium sp.]|uniref:hypothetical protein n=1 Tax=Methanohalobium sp. TaxID=2837493 RepID=UPI0039780A62
PIFLIALSLVRCVTARIRTPTAINAMDVVTGELNSSVCRKEITKVGQQGYVKANGFYSLSDN